MQSSTLSNTIPCISCGGTVSLITTGPKGDTGTGATGATGMQGLDGNSSVWQFTDDLTGLFNNSLPGARFYTWFFQIQLKYLNGRPNNKPLKNGILLTYGGAIPK